MISVWWLVFFFILGGACGVMLMAMLQVSSYRPREIDPEGISPMDAVTR